jgi:hypothetical protein
MVYFENAFRWSFFHHTELILSWRLSLLPVHEEHIIRMKVLCAVVATLYEQQNNLPGQ